MQIDNLKQEGPTHFLTMSKDSGARYFTFRQETGAVQGRLNRRH